MRRATRVYAKGDWPATEIVATVTLTLDDRHRRRFRMTDDDGGPFLLDLEAATLLGDGDGLALDGGGIIAVVAADEPVADVRCRSAVHAARLAWHIGNRHVAVQVLEDAILRIRDDHVLVRMLEGLGAEVTCHLAPFSPEPGAYAHHGAAHSHGH